MTQRDVTIRIDGLNKLLRALEKLDDEAADDFKSAALTAGNIVVKEGKRQVPVRSGRLRDSIRAGKVKRGAKVYAGRKSIPYVFPVHFGWFRQGILPNPFLYRAVDRRADEVVDAYLDQVYKTWNREV